MSIKLLKIARRFSKLLKAAEDKEDIAFAVFAVVEVEGGLAATTRPREGGIGLPGGKVDPGETEEEALFREAAEEGWQLEGEAQFIHEDHVDGKLIRWYKVDGAKMLSEYKESHRLVPTVASREEIAESGYGNEFIANINI